MSNEHRLIRISRWLNRRLRGHPEKMLSANVYDNRNTIAVVYINWLFFFIRGERNHCRRCARYERRKQRWTTPSSPSLT